MEYRRLGEAGLKVSEIALGTALSFSLAEQKAALECIWAAVESGVNFIDSADVYPVYAHGEAEQVIGAAIRELGLRRDDLVLSSKVFWPMSDDVNDRGLSRKHIVQSIEGSLRRLGTDYLDIYFCHRFDPEAPVDEVVRAMDDLIHQGKVLYWGTSVWSAAQIEQAVGAARAFSAYPPQVEQPWYSMLSRHIEGDAARSGERPWDLHVEPSVLDTCARNGIGVTAFWPLAEGLLTGKYSEGIPSDSRAGRTEMLGGRLTEENLESVRRLTRVAHDLGLEMSQLALAWILRRPEISSVIVGASRPAQVVSNAKASGVHLPTEALDQIEAILHYTTAEDPSGG